MKIKDIRDDYQVLIIGCGRLGASIANALSNRNKNVTADDSTYSPINNAPITAIDTSSSILNTFIINAW